MFAGLFLSLPPALFFPLISHQTTFSCTRKIPNFSCQHNGIFKEFAGWRLTGVPNWINIFLFTEGFPPFLRVLGLLSLQLHLTIMLPWRRSIRTSNNSFNRNTRYRFCFANVARDATSLMRFLLFKKKGNKFMITSQSMWTHNSREFNHI